MPLFKFCNCDSDGTTDLEGPVDTQRGSRQPSRVSFAPGSDQSLVEPKDNATTEPRAGKQQNLEAGIYRGSPFIAPEKFRIFSGMHSPSLSNTTFAKTVPDVSASMGCLSLHCSRLYRPTQSPSKKEDDEVPSGVGGSFLVNVPGCAAQVKWLSAPFLRQQDPVLGAARRDEHLPQGRAPV